jgi:hypothetical protein
MKCIYTLEELRARVKYWQSVLRLQDWDIDVQFQHMSLMSGFSAQAHLDQYHKKALISIATEESYNCNLTHDQDMEEGLVHEIIELLFAPFKNNKMNLIHISQETAINMLTCGLLRLHRELSLKGDNRQTDGA